MKVKIMSMHRVVNYGSFMQAYALKRVVESFGHQVSFADFKKGLPRHRGCKVQHDKLLKKLLKIPKIIASPSEFYNKRSFRKKIRKCYESKAWEALGINANRDYDTDCDLMIIGSDEVFNYTQNHAFGYVPVLFGHGVAAHNLIAYAASAGYATIKDIEADCMAEELIKGFKKFNFIGVRDRNTYDMVTRYSNSKPVMVLDPTLIYDFSNEIKYIFKKSEYLLVYAYDGRLDSPEDIAKIRSFALSRNLKVVSVGFYHQWCDENLVLEPFELLSLFEQASYVVTDTFHGTIFSIKSRKPFVSLLREENKFGSNFNKLDFLLAQLGLSDRINRNLEQLGIQLNLPINYEQVEQTMAPLQEASMNYLSSMLGPKIV